MKTVTKTIVRWAIGIAAMIAFIVAFTFFSSLGKVAYQANAHQSKEKAVRTMAKTVVDEAGFDKRGCIDYINEDGTDRSLVVGCSITYEILEYKLFMKTALENM